MHRWVFFLQQSATNAAWLVSSILIVGLGLGFAESAPGAACLRLALLRTNQIMIYMSVILTNIPLKVATLSCLAIIVVMAHSVALLLLCLVIHDHELFDLTPEYKTMENFHNPNVRKDYYRILLCAFGRLINLL